MENIKEYLSVIDYPLTDELFLLFFGSKNDLENLVEEGTLVPTDNGDYIISEHVKKYLITNSQEKLHRQMYDKYIRYLSRNHSISYKNVYFFRNLFLYASKHSLIIRESSTLIEDMVNYYKWFLQWNINCDWFWMYVKQLDSMDDKSKKVLELLRIKENIRRGEGVEEIKEQLENLLGYTADALLLYSIYNMLSEVGRRLGDNDFAMEMLNMCKKVSQDVSLESALQKSLEGVALLQLSMLMYKKNNNRASCLKIIERAKELIKDDYYIQAAEIYTLRIMSLEDKEFNISPERVDFLMENYPDLALLYVNIFLDQSAKNNTFHEYFLYKTISLYVALQLHSENFLREFFSLLHQIYEWKDQELLGEEIEQVIEFFGKIDMTEEALFFKGVREILINGKQNEEYSESIQDPSLREIAIEYYGKLIEK